MTFEIIHFCYRRTSSVSYPPTQPLRNETVYFSRPPSPPRSPPFLMLPQGRGKVRLLGLLPAPPSPTGQQSGKRRALGIRTLTFLYLHQAPQLRASPDCLQRPPRPPNRAHTVNRRGKFGTRNSAHQPTSVPPTQNRLQHPTSGRRSSFHQTIWGAVFFFPRNKRPKEKKNSNHLAGQCKKRGGRSQRGGRAPGLVPQGMRKNTAGARFSFFSSKTS